MHADWPFQDSPDTACFTTREVLIREKPILLVIHDSDDDCWHFLFNTDGDEMHIRVVSLGELLKIDPGIAELACLPPGRKATRRTVADNWYLCADH